MTESIIVIVVSVLVLLLLALTFVYFYFRSIKQEVSAYWEMVLQKLGVRLDKLPVLVETVRRYEGFNAEVLNNLTDARAKAWGTRGGKERVHAELAVSSSLHKVWELTKSHGELNHDTSYLEVKMELKEIVLEIEEMGDVYNNKVRNFNKLAGFVLFKPFIGLMGFGKMPIFEFEG